MAAVRSRNWCVTHNNYAVADISRLQGLDDVRYSVIGKEVGESGTPHLQITLVYKNAKTFAAVKKQLSLLGSPHIEPCVDLPASILYCQKDGDFVESGEKPDTSEEKGDKEKKRWAVALERAKEGRFEEIDPQIQISQCRNLEWIHLRQLASEKLNDTEELHQWYYGPTGTGKSRRARTEHPDAYLKMCNKWWDHYQNEDVVLLEDFDKKHDVLIHHLKIWADRYTFLGEIKGQTRKIRPRLLIVTSNYHPSEIWSDPADLEPILRRFKVTHFANPFNQ